MEHGIFILFLSEMEKHIKMKMLIILGWTVKVHTGLQSLK